MADLKPKLNPAPILSDSFYQLTDIPQGVLPLRALEQQVLALKHNRDYVFSTHQQIWQPPIKLDDTCIKSICQASRLTSDDGHSQQITTKKQDQNTACHKIEFNNQEAEISLKTENFEIQIDITDGLKKEIKKKKKKKSTQIKKERSKPVNEKKVHTRRSRNYWLPKEDEMLLELRKVHGDQWTKIASCLEGRTGKQVRDRYLNYLKPSIKQKTWSKYEEELLDMLYKTFGNKWSTIASYLPGRTENQVKNRFYAGVKRGKYHKKKKMNAQKEEAEQAMKFAKLDPEFENRLLVFKSEEVSSIIPLNTIKSEAFETCDSVSQSSQVISKGKRINTNLKNEEEEYNIQTKNSTSCLGNFCIKEEFDPEAARNQRTLSRESIKSDSPNKNESLRLKEEEQLMKIEEDLIHGYKKIKCEIKAEMKIENSDKGNIAYNTSNELLTYQSY